MKQVFSKIILASGLAIGVSGGFNAMAQEQIEPDIERGEKLYTAGDNSRGITACVACHGATAESAIEMYPHLAGQHPEYIIKSLENFQPAEGETESNRMEEGGSPTPMAPIAAQMTDQDRVDLAYYIAQFDMENPVAAKFAGDTEMVHKGRKIWRGGIPEKNIPACAACHGASGEGIPSTYPRLSGQFPSYLEKSLIGFADGYRKNGGPENQMGEIANRMSRDEIKAVADYAAGIR